MSGSVQIVLPPFPIFIPLVSCSLRGYFALFLKWLDTWRQVVTSHVKAKWWHKYFFDRKLCSSGQRNSDLALNIWLCVDLEGASWWFLLCMLHKYILPDRTHLFVWSESKKKEKLIIYFTIFFPLIQNRGHIKLTFQGALARGLGLNPFFVWALKTSFIVTICGDVNSFPT